MKKFKKGFTLIELLVVIAVIAILAAILFPVFAKARGKARQTNCTSNQKQIVATALMYTQDHDETFPDAASFWSVVNLDKGVLRCPSTSKLTNGYVYNNLVAGQALGTITPPELTDLSADGSHTASAGTGFNADTYDNVKYDSKDFDIQRHSGKMIMSYVDGHVGLSVTAPIVKVIETGVPTNGLVMWLKPESLPATGSVSSWSDSSTIGTAATQGNSGLKPAVVTNAVNNLRAAHFQSQCLVASNAAFAISQSSHTMLVLTRFSGSNVECDIVGTGGISNNDMLLMIYGGAAWAVRGHVWRGPTLVVKDGTTSNVANTWVLAGQRMNATQLQVLRNGIVEASQTLSGTPGISGNQLIIGSRTTTGYAGNHDIAEVLIYNRAISDTELGVVKTYINEKYALSL